MPSRAAQSANVSPDSRAADGDRPRSTAKLTGPAACTASKSREVGVDFGPTVARDYFARRPIKCDGKINRVNVELQ